MIAGALCSCWRGAGVVTHNASPPFRAPSSERSAEIKRGFHSAFLLYFMCLSFYFIFSVWLSTGKRDSCFLIRVVL